MTGTVEIRIPLWLTFQVLGSLPLLRSSAGEIYINPMRRCLLSDKENHRADVQAARHEAGHAVAKWALLGGSPPWGRVAVDLRGLTTVEGTKMAGGVFGGGSLEHRRLLRHEEAAVAIAGPIAERAYEDGGFPDDETLAIAAGVVASHVQRVASIDSSLAGLSLNDDIGLAWRGAQESGHSPEQICRLAVEVLSTDWARMALGVLADELVANREVVTARAMELIPRPPS